MTKAIVLGLALVCMAFASRGIVEVAKANERGEIPCREGRRPYNPTEVARIIDCAVNRWGPIPGGVDFAVAVGRCESGLRPRAVSSSGTYRGVYQYGPVWEDFAAEHYWRSEWGRRGVERPSVWNARAQAIVTVRYVAAGGWQPWSCAG